MGLSHGVRISTRAAICALARKARLAQSVERKALNLVAVGSSPTVGAFCRGTAEAAAWAPGAIVEQDLAAMRACYSSFRDRPRPHHTVSKARLFFCRLAFPCASPQMSPTIRSAGTTRAGSNFAIRCSGVRHMCLPVAPAPFLSFSKSLLPPLLNPPPATTMLILPSRRCEVSSQVTCDLPA